MEPKQKILIVDDSEMNRAILSEMLKKDFGIKDRLQSLVLII